MNEAPRPGSPRVVVLAGSLNPTSRTDLIATWCGRRLRECGVASAVYGGGELAFAFYRPGGVTDPSARAYLDHIAGADGIVLVSPAYHGAPSGLLKNALDYLNELAGHERPYLHGRGVGCVAVAAGEQGASATIASLRTIAHALRGWPTPLGVTLAGERATIDDDGVPAHPRAVRDLTVMLGQVLTMADRAPGTLADPFAAASGWRSA